jgi:16S rRNA (adenine1518-N6/adenine1519-N6)-dimethyltransferase
VAGQNAPNKRLGQHWLSDADALDAMRCAADVGPDDTVLEIGPGLGTLTMFLVMSARRVIAVEYDADLVRMLDGIYDRLPEYRDKLEIVNQDILRFDLTSLSAGYKVAANIPYYLTSQLLRVLCESPNPFSKAALLIQKEVAERVCAKPGSMGLLSVTTQYYCECELGRVVPAKLFNPPPKVDSQILILTYRTEPLFPDVDTATFFRVVKAGFANRRKTLENSLSAGLHISKQTARDAIAACGLDPNIRAQALSLDDWRALYGALGYDNKH